MSLGRRLVVCIVFLCLGAAVPRSAELNTELGFVIDSASLARKNKGRFKILPQVYTPDGAIVAAT